ncbi:MAG: hypothetical protein HW421_2040 [Ignavibacteria bacterium]|nr:hypothetical protein [Ignavibacteria bacterium]
MPNDDYFPTKDGDIVGTTTKTVFDLSNPNPAGPTFAQVKAQKGDLISPPSNVIVI